MEGAGACPQHPVGFLLALWPSERKRRVCPPFSWRSGPLRASPPAAASGKEHTAGPEVRGRGTNTVKALGLERDGGLEACWVGAPRPQQAWLPTPLSDFSPPPPAPHPSPSLPLSRPTGPLSGAPEGLRPGPAGPPLGILGISPFSTSYGNAGRRGTGNRPSELWVLTPPWRPRRVLLQ